MTIRQLQATDFFVQVCDSRLPGKSLLTNAWIYSLAMSEILGRIVHISGIGLFRIFQILPNEISLPSAFVSKPSRVAS